jgi:membrane protein implicated in regulation of membrane protease activity
VGWALWHLVMLVSPETGSFEFGKLGLFLIDLPLYCLIFAWFFERGHRSMAVAMALHAGAHLDNIYRAPEVELRLQLLRFAVLAVAAAFAARSLVQNASRH